MEAEVSGCCDAVLNALAVEARRRQPRTAMSRGRLSICGSGRPKAAEADHSGGGVEEEAGQPLLGAMRDDIGLLILPFAVRARAAPSPHLPSKQRYFFPSPSLSQKKHTRNVYIKLTAAFLLSPLSPLSSRRSPCSRRNTRRSSSRRRRCTRNRSSAANTTARVEASNPPAVDGTRVCA